MPITKIAFILILVFISSFNVTSKQSSLYDAQSQYRFQQSIQLPEKLRKLDNFGILENSTIAINGFQTVNDNIKQIKVFSGKDYQTKINQINTTQYSTVKYFNSKIFISQGSNIYQNNQTSNNTYKYSAPFDQFNSQPFVTDKFIIFHLKDDCPSLAVIDRVTMKISTIFPDGQFDCDCYRCDIWQGVLKDLQNGKIAYGVSQNLYILCADTLQVQQKIIQSKQLQGTYFTSIESFYNKATQQSIILIKGSNFRYETFSYNKNKKMYEESGRIQGTSQDMKLVGINQGYSFQNDNKKNQLLHWNKIQKLILYENTTQSDQCLLKNKFMTMPKSENFFIMIADFGFYIYELNDTSPSYDIKLKKLEKLKYSLERGQLTSDQKLLVLFSQRLYLSFYDLSSETIIQLLTIGLQDFIVFNSIYDRFIIVKGIYQTIDTNNKTYSIEIRKVSDPQTLIKEVPLILPLQNQVFEVKLIHNDAWGLDFLVLFKIQDLSISTDKTVQQFCSLQNDQIIQKQMRNQKVSYFNTFASQKWIVTMLFGDPTIYILDRNTLTQLRSFLNIGFSLYYKQRQAYFYGNTLIVEDPIKNQLLFLDLEKNTVDQIEIMRSTVSRLQNLPLIQTIIYFPQKKIIYGHTFYTTDNSPCKIIYNATFPIDKVIVYDNQSDIKKQIYVSKSKNSNSKVSNSEKVNLKQSKTDDCDMVISKDNSNKLIVWKNCEPFNETKSYKTRQLLSAKDLKLYMCSDNKHIVFAYDSFEKGYMIQIRSIQDDFKIVWQIIPSSNYFQIGRVDITEDNILIYNDLNKVTITNFSSIETGARYNLQRIYDFIYNQKGDLAITGYYKQFNKYNDILIGFVVANNEKKVIFKHQALTTSIYSAVQSKIRFNEDSTKILICYTKTGTDIKIQVWNIQSNQLIFQYQKPGSYIEIIEFLNQTHFITRISNKTEIISYQSTQTSKLNRFGQTPNQISQSFMPSLPIFQKIAFSNDGSMFALLEDSVKGNINIFNNNQTVIAHIELKDNQKIQQLLFDNYNKLYIIDNTTKIFTFSKSTCGQTFINVNSYCQCRANLTLVDSACQCQQNFQKYDDNSCICTGSDKCFYQNQCIICSFMCSECNGPGLSCTVFSVWFYVIFIGGPLILICTVITVIFIKNKKKLGDDFDECKDKEVKKNGQKKVKISEATSKDLLIDESLESQLRN